MRKIFYLYLFTLLSIFNGCEHTGLSQPKQSEQYVLQGDMIDVAKQRIDVFKDQIQFSLENLKVTNSPPNIELIFRFTNITKSPIVFKKPRSTGFASWDSSHSVFNDVSIIITDNNDNRVKVAPTSSFKTEAGMQDIIQSFEWHKYSDFIVIEPGSSYAYQIDDFKPMILVINGKDEPISEGEYKLYAGYGNIYFGYQDVGREINNYDFLNDNSTKIMDLNAWVGTILSNKIDLEIR